MIPAQNALARTEARAQVNPAVIHVPNCERKYYYKNKAFYYLIDGHLRNHKNK
jgi:hypothetical protein